MKLLNTDHLAHANKIVTALQHPKRQQIINWLDKHPKSSVSEIAAFMKRGPTECSGHLAKLRGIALLVTQKDGKKVLYSIDVICLACMNDLLDKLFDLAQGE